MRTLIPFLLFLISFGVYLKTLCPVVYWEDSGELITASYTLGIPHPSGYPLYCLLGKLFTFLPFGSIAYRVNLMSAFFASLTVVLVYLVILKIQNTGKLANWQTGKLFTSHIPAISASLLFAFSPTFWSRAVIAEVYTLNAFFLALSILVLLKWKESFLSPNSELPASPAGGRTPNSTRYLYLFALIYGLSLGNHLSMALLIFPLLYFLFTPRNRISFEARDVLTAIFLFLGGLLIYLYLPIRSLANPPLDSGNPEGLRSFLAVITQEQYRFLLFSGPGNQVWGRMKILSHSFIREFSLFCLPFTLVGFFFLGKKSRTIFIFLLGIFLIYFLIGLGLDTPHVDNYYLLHFIPTYFVFALGVGRGMGETIQGLFPFLNSKRAYILVVILLLTLPLSSFILHYQENDRSANFLAYDYAGNVLNSLAPRAILFTRSINVTAPIWYLQQVEGKRQDVSLIWQHLLTFPWYIQQLPNNFPELKIPLLPETSPEEMAQGIIDLNITDHPIYYTVLNKGIDISQYSVVDFPLVSRIERKGVSLSQVEIPYVLRGVLEESIYKDQVSRIQISNYASLYEEKGKRMLARRLREEGQREIERIRWLNPNYPPVTYPIKSFSP